MAAITTEASPIGNHYQLNGQASSGTLTKWLLVPSFARYAFVFLNPTTVGTSVTPSFLAIDPVALDDDYVILVAEHAALTAITAAGQYAYQIGPGVTGIANDVTQSATADSYVSLNAVLPPILGVRIVSSGSCVYNLAVHFRGK